ncbi:carcinoembryonic antigen-related cell adhesion molecule 1-like [Artibeus jamaicensis]|uniref:carcinoembryonic antigen-related cell adhesion molecule 1-like n=1 Tax=Artibeus jamaicensis TaxID=9417 RepID=UPI00235AEE38|nr:carcinoembryonic antigen-related cell adhesion molecule 1-like [Artibeus jamaicensis]
MGSLLFSTCRSCVHWLGFLLVEPVKAPILLTSDCTVPENNNAVVLICHTNADSIEWFFNGTNLGLSEKRKLSEDHRNLTIDPVEREDSGYYQCKVSNPISSAEISLLTFRCLLTNAQFSVVSTNVAEGKDVRLSLRNTPPNVTGYRWFRGESGIPHDLIAGYFILERKFVKGRLYDGRKIVDLDGSLLIRKATREDKGIYTVVAHLPNSVQRVGFGWLDVFEPVKAPILLTSDCTVPENNNAVVLICHTNADSIEWFFNGTNLGLSEKRKLSEDHRNLTIDPVEREDSGYYQCKVSNPISSAEISLLTFRCLLTNAQFSVVSTNVAEGKDVRLSLRNTPPNVTGYRWFRGESGIPHDLIAGYFILERKFVKGRLYDRRKIVDLDGSLLIRKATREDKGIYTVVAHLPNSVQRVGFGWLDVFEPVKAPILLTSDCTVPENNNAVVLICHTNADSIEWFFNGTNLGLSEKRKLSEDHRNLTIDPVEREDSGYYQCKVSNPISSAESWLLELHIQDE